MDYSLKLMIIVDQRKFTSGHRMVGGEEAGRSIMEEPSDGLYEKQKHGRIYSRR